MKPEELIKGVILSYYKETTLPKITNLKILSSDASVPAVSLSWKESRKIIKVKAFISDGELVVTKLV